MLQELRLQMGGAAPSLFFLKPGRLASTHTSPFQTHAVSIAFANGGGCAPPPPPTRPALFLPAGFASTHTNPFQTHAASIAFANEGVRPPPTPPLFLNHQTSKETPNPKP